MKPLIEEDTESGIEGGIALNASESFTGQEEAEEAQERKPIAKISMGETSDLNTAMLTKNILKGAIPCMIQFFSTMFVNNTTIHFVGLKNDMVLYNGISLALNILNCFSFYVIFHSNIGFNAAASQALGAKNRRLVGLYLHRAFILHFMVNIVAYGILCAAPFVFKLAGLDADVTNTAFDYLVLTPGYIIGVIIFDTIKNFLYAHKIFTPLVVIQVIIATVYWFLADTFLLKMDLGIQGIIIAVTICQFIGVILLISYLIIAKPKNLKGSWIRPGKHSFKGLLNLAKVMVSVGGMGYVEVFAYRIQSFSSAAFSSAQFAALTAFLAFGDLFYVLPVGISFPVVTFIGNAMGRGDKHAVMKIMKVTLVISSVILLILLTVYAFIKKYLFEFYTQDPDVLSIMMTMGYLYFFTFPADFYQTILAGIIKGLAKEKIGTKAFLIALYFVGLPLALILGFVAHYYSPGMWLGNGIGIYFTLGFFTWIIYKTNFGKQFDYIKKRVST